jgi:hypothetical protein
LNWIQKAFANDQAEIDAPAAASLRWLRPLFVLFLFSFLFDYKSPDLEFGAVATGGSVFQFAFLGLALLSGGLATVLGWRRLLVRPGVYLVFLWWGYVAFALAVAFLWGNEPGRALRLSIPLLLVGLGLNATLAVASSGMRPGEAARWFLVAALGNVVWRFAFGATAHQIPLSEIRMEVLSPAMGFLFAWSACALLLRLRFTWWTLLAFGLPLSIAAISVTRSLALPLVVSFLTAGFCLALAMLWRLYDLRFPLRKTGPLLAMGAAMVVCVAAAALVDPTLGERWYQRMFDNRGIDGATSEDLSSLMRKAEAKSMWDILAKQPHSFIYGRGLGASYYWDESYYPELFLVYPDDRHQFPDEIYSAGHSIWTYALFSTGFLGIAVTLLAFFIPMGLSLHAAWLVSRTVMGLRAWDGFLVFLPFVAMWATLSESITRNPFDERFTGVLLGFMMALPQFFYNRACYLRHREAIGQAAPQIILDEETAAGIHEMEPPPRPLFQGRAEAPAAADGAGVGGGGGHHLVSCRYEFEPPPGRAPSEP